MKAEPKKLVAVPTGDVTFLFTDVEGSSQLWEHQPTLMRMAIARHDELLRSCIETHRGFVFKTVGDAFCAAFPSADDGMYAALDAQRALKAESWEPSCVIRVRMGLHSGTAEERDDDYFGPPVNRAARLMSAGHGGQTLLSGAVHEAVLRKPLKGIEFQDLGVHRLKDLIEPEHIFQLVAPGLAREFAPLKVLDYLPTNLPVQSTVFVGREEDLRAIADELRQPTVRLLTLTGPGGTGKTRLSLQVGANLIDEFADGVYFVDLAAISDPALVLSTIAGALHVRETAGRTLKELLIDYLLDKRLLLILDNFEHLLVGATVVADLLGVCPHLTVLVTSRAPLHISAEREFPVFPLSVPDPDHLPDLDELARYDSVELFVERAGAVKPGFALTDDNARAIAGICYRLDGLPLAIELAAARIRLFPPAALLSRLTSRLKLLTGGARDLPSRQQTLRGAIDWSYSLLDEGERHLFARLSVFMGGCTFEAVELVCNADADLEIDVLDGLSSLVEKSLLRQQEQGDEPRFLMLETLREYAAERLESAGEVQELRARHATFYLEMAEEASPAYYTPDQDIWLRRLEAEHSNMRAALDWALQSSDDEQAAKLGTALQWFWFVHGYLTEGRKWLRLSLAHASGSRTSARARALVRAGALAVSQGDFTEAHPLLEEGLALASELKDRPVMAEADHELGKMAAFQGEYDRAQGLLEESLNLHRQLNNTWWIGALVNDLGTLAFYQGDHQRATEHFEEALAIARKLGQKRIIAIQLNNLGCMAEREGDYGRGQNLFEEALVLFRALGDKSFVAKVLEELGLTVQHLGDHERAVALLRESLITLRELEDEFGIAECLEMQARVAALAGQPERAAYLLGAASSTRMRLGAPLPPEDEQICEKDLIPAKTQLGDRWLSMVEVGKSLPLDEAVNIALDQTGATVPAGSYVLR